MYRVVLSISCAAPFYNGPGGEIMGVVPKTYIPTYGVDFEGRWFSSGPADVTYITVAGQEHVPFGSHQVFRCCQMPQLCLGYEICEDIWA